MYIKLILYFLILNINLSLDIDSLSKFNSNGKEFKIFLEKEIRIKEIPKTDSYFDLIISYYKHCNKNYKLSSNINSEISIIKNKIFDILSKKYITENYLKNKTKYSKDNDFLKGLTFLFYYNLFNNKKDKNYIKSIYESFKENLNNKFNKYFKKNKDLLESLLKYEDDILNQISIIKEYLLNRQKNLSGICSYLIQLKKRWDSYETFEENKFKEYYNKEINFHFDWIKILYEIIIKYDDKMTPEKALDSNLIYFYEDYYVKKKNKSNKYFVTFLENLIALLKNFKINEEYKLIKAKESFSNTNKNIKDYIKNEEDSLFSYYSILFFIIRRSKEYNYHYFKKDKTHIKDNQLVFQKNILLEYFKIMNIFSMKEKKIIAEIFEPLFVLIYKNFINHKQFELYNYLQDLDAFYYYYANNDLDSIKNETNFPIFKTFLSFNDKFFPMKINNQVNSFIISIIHNINYNPFTLKFIKSLVNYQKNFISLNLKDQEKVNIYFYFSDDQLTFEFIYYNFIKSLDDKINKIMLIKGFNNDNSKLKRKYKNFKFLILDSIIINKFKKIDKNFDDEKEIVISEKTNDKFKSIINFFSQEYNIKKILTYIINKNLDDKNYNKENLKTFLLNYKKYIELLNYDIKYKFYNNLNYILKKLFEV